MAIKENSWLRVHRAIRALPDGEGPFRGLLVADGDATVVAVALTQLEHWEGWPFAGALHVAGPKDIALLDNGFSALMPWCTLEVESFLARRRIAADSLSSGEAVTLSVSVIRGLAELGDAAGRLSGRWWLTYDSRPVFVIGQGLAAGAAAAEVFAGIAATTGDRALNRVFERLGDAASHPRTLARESAQWEQDILACAAPKPIRTEVLERNIWSGANEPLSDQHRANGATLAIRELRAQPSNPAPQQESSPQAARWRQLIAEGLERIPERARFWQRGTSEKLSPKRRLAVGAVAAGAVLLISSMWPPGEEGTDYVLETTGQASLIGDPSPGDTDPVTDDETVVKDPLSGFIAAVALARQCLVEADEVCATVLATTAEVTTSILLNLVDTHDEATLADDFGDVAVLRLENSDSEFAIVVERKAPRWLVRDIYQLRGA
jgi:hypothetical protein